MRIPVCLKQPMKARRHRQAMSYQETRATQGFRISESYHINDRQRLPTGGFLLPSREPYVCTVLPCHLPHIQGNTFGPPSVCKQWRPAASRRRRRCLRPRPAQDEPRTTPPPPSHASPYSPPRPPRAASPRDGARSPETLGFAPPGLPRRLASRLRSNRECDQPREAVHEPGGDSLLSNGLKGGHYFFVGNRSRASSECPWRTGKATTGGSPSVARAGGSCMMRMVALPPMASSGQPVNGYLRRFPGFGS